MTETSSQIANALVDKRFDGGMKLLSGYTVRVVDPDAEGFGKLAVRGPGVTAATSTRTRRAPWTASC